jgi:hypothetical protein
MLRTGGMEYLTLYGFKEGSGDSCSISSSGFGSTDFVLGFVLGSSFGDFNGRWRRRPTHGRDCVSTLGSGLVVRTTTPGIERRAGRDGAIERRNVAKLQEEEEEAYRGGGDSVKAARGETEGIRRRVWP